MLPCWLIELKNKKTGRPPLSQWLSAPVILPVDWEFCRLFVKQFVQNRGPFDSRSVPAYSTVWVHAICIYVRQYYNAMLILCMLSDIVRKKRENLFCCDKIWEDLTVTGRIDCVPKSEGRTQPCICFLARLQYRNKLGFSGYESLPEVTL